MIDEDAKSHAPEAEENGDRASYARPVLTRLGSVNRLTLSQSSRRRGDGTKQLPKIFA